MKPVMNPQTRTGRLSLMLFVAAMIFVAAPHVSAQGNAAELKAKAEQLFSQSKMTEALPVIEQWIAADPDDALAHERHAFALIGKAIHVTDPAERKTLRVQARGAFIKSKMLGNKANLIAAMIDSLPEDGSEGPGFSEDPKSHALTVAGEKAFTSGKIDEAIELYKQAAAADPKNYFAPLFVGDMLIKKEAFVEAELWYQKAIVVDPYKETAYRYSGTPLMRQKKYDEALERYIDAWITEPYNRLAMNGIIQWGQITGTRLGHPKLDIPEIKAGADGKTNTTININPLAVDDSMAWMAYVTTRELWSKEKFKKAYPKESAYRHSLAEEADSLREVVKMAKSLKSEKKNPQIEAIGKMDSDGVLEAFVLLAIPTRGIAEDHAAYLRANREKMRLYIKKYVVEPGK
ncbi:MAG: tetratricopeptide repeat protein [Pyrinomonadaceae bacterium]